MNIWTGRAGGLETALQKLHQGEVDVGFLQETTLKQGIHTSHGAGYNVATDVTMLPLTLSVKIYKLIMQCL